MDKKVRFTLDYSSGSNGGHALYVNDNKEDCGYRLFGPKCWGFVKTISSFSLTESVLDEAIDYFQSLKRQIKEDNGEEKNETKKES